MSRLYFALLLVGMSAAAHASGDSISKSDQSAAQVSAEADVPYGGCESSVVLNRTVFVAPAGSEVGIASGSHSLYQAEKEAATASNVRVSGSSGAKHIWSLARHKRVEITGESYTVTLRQDSASIEAGHLRVALRAGATALLWTTAL